MEHISIICPVCHEKLNKQDHNFVCNHGHLFNVSKEGYLNLLLNTSHSGDNQEMLHARRKVLEKGYFSKLLEELLSILNSLQIRSILDVGCGEGYYDKNIYERLHLFCTGIDISKEACKMAAKKCKDIFYLVARVNSLPFLEDSFDLILNIFAPHDEQEFYRVSRRYLLKVTPGKHHLLELKQHLYQDVYIEEEKRYQLKGFIFVLEKELCYSVEVDDMKELFQMTPYYYKTDPSKRNDPFPKGHITMHFYITLYEKQ